ncbi:hypothetical protein R83H12_02371 [Fibrobacteria bacterium R8-3-H12]
MLVLSDGLDKEEITPRLQKIGFFTSHWYPTEKELSLYLGQRLREKKLEGVSLDLGDEEIRRVASLLTGCGKSLSAKCIAASFKQPLYRLDFATVQNKWLGESERRLNSKAASRIAPQRSL